MQKRPVYLDLTKISLPASALSSITHRLSGIYIFFVTLPLMLFLIDGTTSTKAEFDALILKMETVSLFSMFVFFSLSIFWYHILTGLRHLIMDFLHIGETIKGSRYSSLFVIFIWLVSLVISFWYLFL